MERAAIFIDGANVMYQQRHLGWKIDWLKILHFVNEKHRVVSARFYTALKEPPSEDQKSFLRMLATTGYSLKTKQLKRIKDPETGESIYKGNLDIELVIDALTTIDQYDVFILFSGDSDFVPLITALRQQRKVVKAFSTQGFSSIDLVSELGMDFKDINDYKSRLELKETPNSQSPKTAPNAKPKSNAPPKKETISFNLPDIGDEFTGDVIAIKEYGLFLTNEYNAKALLHVKNMNIGFVSVPLDDLFSIGDRIKVQIENIDTTQAIKEISVSLADDRLRNQLLSKINT